MSPSAESWVLITGGNRGLGYVTAKKLVEDGESVIVGARTQASADEAVAKLGKETGHPERVAALAVEVSNSKSIEAAASALERDYAGKLGGLINNAGIATTEVTEQEYNRLWATNVAGLFNLTARLTPLISEGGHIVHVASTLGQLDGISPALTGVKAYITGAKSVQELIDMPHPAEDLAKVKDAEDRDKTLLYNITKAAVLHGTKLQAVESALTSRRITVAAVCPGWCRTDMGSDKAPRPSEDGAKSIAYAYISPKARGSNGGFFQDNRPLSIVETDPDRFGPAKWIEE